jgi:Glycosyl hydrolases family 2, sugar binding domain/Glycosyl hydrolases family 2/Glycosyl hydrolases family 2, TIM barrel domain
MIEQELPVMYDIDKKYVLKSSPNALPRSVIRNNEYELLDGEWRFELDVADRGLQDHWFLGHEFSTSARWPGLVEDYMATAVDEEEQNGFWQDRVVAWYERDFVVPAHWHNDANYPVQITFGACGYETRAWLNAHALHTIEGEEVHFGSYTSFSYELPAENLQAVNRLTVRIAHSMDAEIPRGKQESHVYKRGGIWYQTISGPARSSWLEPIERNRLRSRLDVFSQVQDHVVEFILTTNVQDPGIYTLRLVITGLSNAKPLTISEFTLPLQAGERRQRFAVVLPDAQPWSPATPILYNLVAQLIEPDKNISQIESRFGLRHVRTGGNSIYLNNEPIYLDGILYQPGIATYEQMRRHLLAIKSLGCNLVRVHIAGIDPRIYDLADEIGLLLWVEVPCPHSSSQRSRANHWAELMRMLVGISAHPSVIIWSLYNEDWGADDIATSAETRAYIAKAYDYLRLNGPQVLVVDNDGWRHVSLEGRLKSDLLTAHMYGSNLGRWCKRLDQFVAGNTEGITSGPLVVGDPFFYNGQLPLVVSEWGGFGFPIYGVPQDTKAKVEQIRAYKRELRKRPIAGDVYTQAVSIEQEVNGLIEPSSGELLVPEGLLNSALLLYL